MDETYIKAIKRVLDEHNEEFNIISIDYLNNMMKNLLFIRDIRYWDDSEEKFIYCDIIFGKRHIECKYDDGYIASNLNVKGLIYITTKDYGSGMWGIYFGTTCILVNESNKVKILDHYNNINKAFQEEIIKDIKMIKEQVENVPQDVVQIILNYFDYLPKSILLDRENFMVFEHLISFSDYYTQNIVDINENQRNYAIDKISKDEDYLNQMNQIKHTNYTKLVKIIGRYLDLNSEAHSSVAWSLIKKYSIEHFTKICDKEYGTYFNESLDKGLDEFVHIYCRIDEINPKNVDTVGIFTYYLMYNNKFSECDNHNFLQCNMVLIDCILKECETIELDQFENKLIRIRKTETIYSIDDADLMSGYEFEQFVGKIFSKIGYSVEITKGSGDQGIDVLVEKNGNKIGVQAKCYSNRVTNKAVQEVVAGLKYYNCHKGIVVTNNYFTESAKELAESNNIILWDRNMLKQKIEDILNKG